MGFDFSVELCYHLVSHILVNLLYLKDLSIRHLHNPVRKMLKPLVMRHHNHSYFMFHIQINKNFHDDVC